MSDQPVQNTDRELWRESRDAFSPSVHVTAHGLIGIHAGGTVVEMTPRAWIELAKMKGCAVDVRWQAETLCRDLENEAGTIVHLSRQMVVEWMIGTWAIIAENGTPE